MLPDRKNPGIIWLTACLTAVALLYAITMSSAITLVDAGLFHMVCADNGIAHPPGYPLATLLCHPFLSLPLPGTIPGNLFSTTFALATLVTVYALARQLAFSSFESAAFSFLLCVSWAFWSQAIVLEIYTLNTFLGVLLLWTALKYATSADSRWLAVSALVFGMGVSNHWPLIILSAIATTPIYLQGLRFFKDLAQPKILGLCVLALCVGLTPYLLMLTKQDTFMTMIGPVNNLSDLFLYVSRSTYEDNALQTGTTAWQYLWWLPLASLQQWGPPGYLFIPVGVFAAFYQCRRDAALALLFLWLSHCALLPVLSSYSFDESLRYYYLVWSIPAHISCALWFLLGARFLLTKLRLSETLTTSMLIVICLFSAGYNFSRTQPTDAHWVENYNRLLLSSLPARAVLFVEGDAETGPLGYLHYVKGVRPDIELRSRHNILFGNRLADPRSQSLTQEKLVQEFVATTRRPVYFISPPSIAPTQDHGYYYRAGHSGFRHHEALHQYMARLIPALKENTIRDPFIRFYLNEILHQYARSVVGDALSSEGVNAAIAKPLALVASTLQGKTWTLHHLTRTNRDQPDIDQLFDLIGSGEAQIDENTMESGAGAFLRLSGDAFAIYRSDHIAALKRYRNAMQYDLANETCDHLAQNHRLEYHQTLNCPLTETTAKESLSKQEQ